MIDPIYYVSIGTTFLGIIFGIAAICIGRMNKRKEKECAVLTTAKVIAVKHRRVSHQLGHHSSAFFPTFEYCVNGETLQRQSNVGGDSFKYKVGQTVNLFVNPHDPLDFYEEKNGAKTLFLIFAILSLVILCVGFGTGILGAIYG